MPMIRSEHAGAAAAFASTVLWGLSYVAMKFALADFHPMTMNFFRMASAFAALALFLPVTLRGARWQRGDWRLFLALVSCEPCLYEICESVALTQTTAAQAGMINATLPVFTGILGYFMLRERLSRLAWTGCGLTIAGAVWLSLSAVSGEGAPNPLLGNSLMAAGMVVAALYAVCFRKLSLRYSAMFIVTVQCLAGAFFFAPALFLPGMGVPQGAAAFSWACVIFLGVGVSCFALTLYGYGMSVLGASRATMFMNLIPVFAVLFSMAILGERMGPVQWLASALVFAGVLLSQKN